MQIHDVHVVHLQSLQARLNLLPHTLSAKVFPIPRVYLGSHLCCSPFPLTNLAQDCFRLASCVHVSGVHPVENKAIFSGGDLWVGGGLQAELDHLLWHRVDTRSSSKLHCAKNDAWFRFPHFGSFELF